MSIEDFITELFCRIDAAMRGMRKHSQANLYPSEVVTLGFLFASKGIGDRAFYRWIKRDYLHLFPTLPDRTRLFRQFAVHPDWTNRFLADPTILGVADSYGLELIHPMREGRSEKQIGKTGKSNHRWIVGSKLCFGLNKFGLIVDWDCDTANVYDATFRALIAQFAEELIVLTDSNFHAQAGDPTNLKLCPRGTWNVRRVVETVLSMLTSVCHFKKVGQRVWKYFQARLASTMAAFNVLPQWHGFTPDENGFASVHRRVRSLKLAPIVSRRRDCRANPIRRRDIR